MPVFEEMMAAAVGTGCLTVRLRERGARGEALRQKAASGLIVHEVCRGLSRSRRFCEEQKRGDRCCLLHGLRCLFRRLSRRGALHAHAGRVAGKGLPRAPEGRRHAVDRLCGGCG